MRPSLRVITKKIVAVAALAALVSGCGGGGGGGGDSFVGAALVSLSISPSEIDAGDRTRVSIEISEVHPDGISLKLKFPDGLRYVLGSSELLVDGDDLDATPTVNAEKEQDAYLVYYFPQERFGENLRGELTLELEGVNSVNDGEIEVDADVDDPAISNAIEFDIENPEFQAEDLAQIRVRD